MTVAQVFAVIASFAAATTVGAVCIAAGREALGFVAAVAVSVAVTVAVWAATGGGW